jgi:hypothetical protein
VLLVTPVQIPDILPIAAMQKEISQLALAKFASLRGGAAASITVLVIPMQT